MNDTELTDAEVQARLEDNPGWAREADGAIHKTFTFHDFVRALQFVNRVAAAAEAAQHHPDIDIRYNKVAVGLSTHDAGGITEKDFSLLEHIEEAASAARGVA